MRLYFVRIFPMLFAIGIIYHVQLIDRIEEVPYTEISWRKDHHKIVDTLFQQGKTLYARNCMACHPNNSKGVVSPAPNLLGVQMRWNDYPKADLFNFIRNSQKMIQEGHPKAMKVGNQWGGVMTAFPDLSDEDIVSLLHFIEKEPYQK